MENQKLCKSLMLSATLICALSQSVPLEATEVSHDAHLLTVKAEGLHQLHHLWDRETPSNARTVLDDNWDGELINKVLDMGFFAATPQFQANEQMTKAEFMEIYAKIISPDEDYGFSEDDTEWYEPYLRLVESKGLLTDAFNTDNMYDLVEYHEVHDVMNVVLLASMGLGGDELFARAKEMNFEILEKHELNNLETLEFTRSDCAVLLYDLISPSHTVKFNVGIVPMYDTEEPETDVKLNGRSPSIDLFGTVPTPPSIDLPEWSIDPNATTSQNITASILANRDFTFGDVSAMDLRHFRILIPELFSQDTGELLIDLDSAYGYEPLNRVTGEMLIVISVADVSDMSFAIAAMEELQMFMKDGGAWHSTSIKLWNESSAIAINDNCIMLVSHEHSDEIVEHFGNYGK